MNIDLENLGSNQVYHLMTQTIIPRPIAWVLTKSEEGTTNLAPFSYFTPLSSSPPLLLISIGKKPNGDKKDTAVNAINTKQLVVHIASVSSSEIMTKTAATLEHNHSEVEELDIELVDFEGYALPRVKEASIAFGCQLHQVLEVGDTPQTLIIAEIKAIHIDDEVIDINDNKTKIYADKLDPLSRLGLGEYAALTPPFTVKRPA